MITYDLLGEAWKGNISTGYNLCIVPVDTSDGYEHYRYWHEHYEHILTCGKRGYKFKEVMKIYYERKPELLKIMALNGYNVLVILSIVFIPIFNHC